MPQPTSQSQSLSQVLSDSFSKMPVFKLLRDYIVAAASGNCVSICHLFAAVFTSARAAVKCLTRHYQSFPYARTLANQARLNYCAKRLEAILYTLAKAPERFLSPAQLRALTRAQAVLAHIWNQPVDFSPLYPYLSSASACPPPRSSRPTPSSSRDNPQPAPSPASTGDSSSPAIPPSSSPEPASPASPSPSPTPVNPLLLRSPGCVLVSVLIQLAHIYNIPVPSTPRPRPSTPSTPNPSPQSAIQNPGYCPARNSAIESSTPSIPQSEISNLKSEIPPSPPSSPPPP